MIKNATESAPPNVTFSSASIRRLNAFKHWAEECYMCGLDTSPLLFTQPILTDYINHLHADEIEKAARKDQTPTMSDPLKNEKDWFKFWEKLKNYVGRIRGTAKIPLTYTVRDHNVPTASMLTNTYDTHTMKIIDIVLLLGDHYWVDNMSLSEILKGLVIDGFGWSFVKQYDKKMDGRLAVLALRRQECEGKTSIKTRKNKAYTSIANANYRGIRKQFTFAQYIAIHQTAHNELDDCNKPIPPSKKVQDFIAGINDPSVDAGITIVLGDDKYAEDFEATQQFLGTLVANQMIHRQAKCGSGDERNVSSTNGKHSTGGGTNPNRKFRLVTTPLTNGKSSRPKSDPK